MRAIPLRDAAAELGLNPRKLRDWLKRHPVGDRGDAYYYQVGRDMLLMPEDLKRLQLDLRSQVRPTDIPDRIKIAMDCLPVPPSATEKGKEVVYFLEAGAFIKIGTTRDIEARIAALQPGCPSPIRVLHTLPGDHKFEHRLHREFADLRVSGEWFRKDVRLTAFIERLYRP